MACLMPLSAGAQQADPAVWGVYARLLGARMAWDKSDSLTFAWYWNGDRTAIVEDQGEHLDTGEIKPLGGGKLSRFVKGKLVWNGSIQPDGAVIWDPAGNFFTQRAGGPFRIRLDGDSALVEEGVVLENEQVTKAWQRRRWVGSLPVPTPVATAASAPEPARSPLAVADTSPTEDKAGPRELSEEDLARLRAGMARDKLRRAETLKREQEAARRQEEARRQQAEYEAREARMAAQRAAEEREEERSSSDAFAGALMNGLGVFKNEMAKNQAQKAQQQAFLANLQRQQQQAADARQREQERQRQAAAQEQLDRQRAAAATAAAAQQQQQRQVTLASNTTANGSRAVQPPTPAPSKAEMAERELRERATAERQRLQQQREQRQAEERAAAGTTSVTSAAAPPAAQASCSVVANTHALLGRNKSEESTRADVVERAGSTCQGTGSLGPIQCSSTRDISIDSHGKQHDLGTRTYECTAVLTCGSREICRGGPSGASAQ